MNRRPIRFGEAWAIDPRAIERGADSIFLLFSPEAPANEYEGGIACVHIRGPLDHHAGFGDNYDAIRQRAKEAFEDEDTHAVVFRIDSPGGAVSGLLDTARAIRGMAEASDKRVVAYVDERAFSAAYALACACDEIVLPESGLCGSIGVISTMASQYEHDKANGFDFVTITSGERKADGHIHVPISEGAKAAEEKRVRELARQFFQMVKESRGLSLKTIRGFQAGLFLGAQAVDDGTADAVMTFDQLCQELAQLDTDGQSGTTFGEPINEGSMKAYRAQLLEQLKAAKAQLATAKGPEKVKAEVRVETLAAQLEAYKKVTEKHVEHSKTHEEDEGDEDEEGNETDRDDDEEGDEDEDEDKGDKKAKSKSAPKAAGKSKARMADEEEEDEEEAAYEDDEEEASSSAGNALAAFEGAKLSPKQRAALHALKASAEQGSQALQIARKLESRRDHDAYLAKIDSAAAEKRLTPSEAKRLRAGKDVEGKPLATKDRSTYLRALLQGRPKALIRGLDESTIPAATPNSLQGQLPPDLQRQLDLARQSIGGLDQEAVLKDFAARMNGKGEV